MAVAELNVKKLAGALTGEVRFAELPRFPAVTRDVAMLTPAALSHGAIENFFRNLDQPLLVDVTLFDRFLDPSGEKLAADRKSMAYSLTYRAPDRTLESAEVDAMHAKVLIPSSGSSR